MRSSAISRKFIFTTKQNDTSELESISQRFSLIVYGIVYFVLFLVNYYWFVSPFYSYAGMITRELPLWVWTVMTTLSLLPLLWLPITCKHPSDYTIWILYVTVIGPFPVMAALTSRADSFENVIYVSIWLVVAFIIFDMCRRVQYLPSVNFPEIKSLVWIWLPIATLLISLLILIANDFQIDFSFDVYERRFNARETVVGGSGLSYALSFLRGTCIPLTITLGLYYRQHFFLLLSLVGVLTIFGFDGTKSSIFILPLIAFVIWLIIKFKHNQGHVILIGLTSLILLAIIEGLFRGNGLLSYVIIRRIMCLPALLTTYYWDFFSNNPHVLFSDNFLSGFITPRYDLPIPRIIGDIYMGRAETNANANMWASGFAHLGYAGVILTSVIGGSILSFIDVASKNNRFVLASVICVVIGLVWSQGALHTSLLTNGVLTSIAALLFFPSSAFGSDHL